MRDVPQRTTLDALALLFDPETEDIFRLTNAEDQADDSVRLVELISDQRHQKTFVQERRDRVLQAQRKLASAGLFSRDNNAMSRET